MKFLKEKRFPENPDLTEEQIIQLFADVERKRTKVQPTGYEGTQTNML